VAYIAVIGAGYVGLTCAAGLASLGHQVICADINEPRITGLRAGIVPITEEGMSEAITAQMAAGRLEFVLGARNASDRSNIHFLCLPTPQGHDGSADLTALLTAVGEIGPTLPTGSVVVNKSTVPVGSAQLVIDAIGREDIEVVSHPEFLREGSAMADFTNPDRIVVGADDEATARRVGELYASIGAPTLYTDTKSAELIKYSANAFLATKLTFVNEMAEVCEQVGADIEAVMKGMGMDRRIGSSYLSPGPGWGGSCFPKDTEALLHIAASADVEFDFLRSVIELNYRHLARIAGKVTTMLGGDVDGKRIAAWGLTFKAGTDDLRDSPSLAVLRLLEAEGADIVAYDPEVSAPPAELPHIKITGTALEAARDAKCVVVLTEWPEFADVDVDELAEIMASRCVVDARNLLDAGALAERSFSYVGVGR